ncbi:hypothetical protein J7438_21140 [Thalassotalea sp. G20_0]|uniref:hypothetical protein n=1 Tax=Thalassotalea sp. G20_0 TaxID=2821093 RepID=UPI001ADCFACF|nr:hypothetical protein [Thalassotalea sp. G20_0]MBO9496568.1 hypothetical protein [Thalassotalea sp. G20_0]
MNKLSPTSTLLPAANVPPSKESEQIAQAFAGLRKVKPSDIDNEHSKCPPESEVHSLQKKTVTIFVGDQLTRLSGIADSLIKDFDVLVDAYFNSLKPDQAGSSHQMYDNTFNIINEIQIPDFSSLSISDEDNSWASSPEKAIKHYDSASETITQQDELLKVVTDILSYSPDQNWSKSDAHRMAGIALTTLGLLYHLLAESPSDSETIEQKISELNQYISRLKASYELDDQENTNVIFDWP